MIAAAESLKVTQDLIDSEIRECPALAPFYAAAKRLGKIVIVDEQKVNDNARDKNV